MSYNKNNKANKFQLIGWILFFFCAVFFIVSATRADDVVMLTGSIIFLLGCIVFTIPFVRKD
jgi:hypothetical protein